MFLKKSNYIPIGQANIQKAGTDVTLVSFGKMMRVAEDAVVGISRKRNRCRTYRLTICKTD